jgi:hypothetical protein
MSKSLENETFEERRERGVSDSGDAGEAEVAERMNAAAEKGFFGIVTDPTPNENYSLETPDDAPTPETDADLFDEARASAVGHPLKDIDKTAAERAHAEKASSSRSAKREGSDA